MKVYARRISIIFFAILSILIVFNYVFIQNGKPVSQNHVLSEVSPGLPVRLRIPKINVDATIQYVGVNSKGEMNIPSNNSDVAWFNLGPRPGESGSAVISGHFDGNSGETAVFTNLDKLKVGDKFYILDNKGGSFSFIVRESRTYDPRYSNSKEAFGLINDGIHLNLITCDGMWDETRKSYTKRLVVFADILAK